MVKGGPDAGGLGIGEVGSGEFGPGVDLVDQGRGHNGGDQNAREYNSDDGCDDNMAFMFSDIHR
ncbi:hypothetical protein GCM10009113_32090 [Marinobacter szutsaonensis]